jgi:Uma2 family endonuclease
MSRAVLKKPEATHADLAALPDHVIGEILDGELVVSPRPAFPHSQVASALTGDLVPFSKMHGRGGPGGWWILYEPELHFGRQTMVPDLAGWRRERMPQIPNVAAGELAPDWVCEIVSPGSVRHDRVVKPRIYATAGVEWMWIIDPIAKTLEVHQRQDEHWLIVATHSEAEVVRAEPFAAVEIALADWWI